MTVDSFDVFSKQLTGSNLTGGKRKKGNGHKATCGCPICKNMKKGKKGGVLLVGGAMCPDGNTDMEDLANCPVTGDPPPVTGDPPPVTGDPPPVTGDPPPVTGGSRRRRRSSSASKSRRKSRGKSRNGGRKKSKRGRR
jgi:hypothetical protein